MKKLFMIDRVLFSLIVVPALLAAPAALAQNAPDQNPQAQASPVQSSSNQSSSNQSPADPSASAQGGSDESASGQSAPVAPHEAPPDNPWYANSDAAYTVSLGTGQLISLYPHVRSDQEIPTGEYADSGQPGMVRARDYRYQFFYGGAINSVYTNSIGGISTGGNSDLVSTSINPYVGLFMPTRTGRYLVQYSGVINPNDTFDGGPQAFHTLTLSGMGSFTERLYWTVSASGSYGSEAARLQGPLSFLVVSSTPIADTTSTAVLLAAKNVVFTETKLGLGWLKSRRDRIGLTVFHDYTGIEGDSGVAQSFGTHTHSLGGRLEYARSLTQRIDLRTYGEGDTSLNGPACSSYGIGAGLGMKLTHSVEFSVEGGPQWNTASCGSPQAANFSASLVKNFGNRDRIYASANRRFTTFAPIDSRWEDDATVGASKGLGRFTLTTDAGYLRGTPITTIIPAYHGYFIAPRLRYKIMNNVGFTAGYRSFHGAGGNLVSGNASYAVVGIEWYPAPIHFR